MEQKRIISLIKAIASMSNVTSSDHFVLAAETYLSYIEQLSKNEGKKQAAKICKEMHFIASRYSLRLPFEPLLFRKSDKEGFPKAIRLLKDTLRGSPNERRLSLTITRFFEKIYINPEVDFSKLTDEGPLMSPEFISGFTKWSDQWVKRFIQKKPSLIRDEFHVTYSSGPNGPAVPYSHYDAYAVSKDRNLMRNIVELLSLQNKKFSATLQHMATGFEPHKQVVHSRICLLPEAGGKTRLIAIGDYWTQQALQPIHDFIMDILRKMETDGTYSQDKQANKIASLAKECAYSFDLTNATDRFPIQIQEILLSHIYGKEVSRLWKDVMVNRDFDYKGKKYRWMRGQPLGFLSSWAVFAFAHHAIIEYLAHLEGINSFREYGVLGDDVVIWHRKVADRYKSLMDTLTGINLKKSIVSDGPPIILEYAKRNFDNGVEITGLKYTVLAETARSIKIMPDFLQLCENRSWEIDRSKFQIPSFLSDKGKELLKVIMFYYAKVEASATHTLTSAGNTVTFTKAQLELAVKQIRVVELYDLKNRYEQILEKDKSFKELFDREGVSYSVNSLWRASNVIYFHPWVIVTNQIASNLATAIDEINDKPLNLNKPIKPVEYLPIPLNKRMFAQSVQSYVSSTVWKAAFQLLDKNAKTVTQNSQPGP